MVWHDHIVTDPWDQVCIFFNNISDGGKIYPWVDVVIDPYNGGKDACPVLCAYGDEVCAGLAIIIINQTILFAIGMHEHPPLKRSWEGVTLPALLHGFMKMR